MNFPLSKDQKDAFDAIVAWRESSDKLLTLGGFAGTGKTHLVSYIREKFVGTRIAFCAFTGKAASVLRSRFIQGKCVNDYIGTIHSLIYYPIIDKKTKKILEWRKQKVLDYDLIIIDEASMVDESIFVDLCSYNIPILAVGDHGQLPPVSGNFNLMENPDIKLETPHRFLENLPLIKVSIMARKEGRIPFGEFGEGVSKLRMRSYDAARLENFVKSNDFPSGDSVILCGFNKTRVGVNSKIRKLLGFETLAPAINDRVICLKNNKKACPPIYNGVQGKILSISKLKKNYDCRIEIDGNPIEYEGVIRSEPFNNEKPDLYESKKDDYFDFGYCITVHKSQGSEFQNVILIEQKCSLWEHARWLYTGVCRAKKNLTILE